MILYLEFRELAVRDAGDMVEPDRHQVRLALHVLPLDEPIIPGNQLPERDRSFLLEEVLLDRVEAFTLLVLMHCDPLHSSFHWEHQLRLT